MVREHYLAAYRLTLHVMNVLLACGFLYRAGLAMDPDNLATSSIVSIVLLI